MPNNIMFRFLFRNYLIKNPIEEDNNIFVYTNFKPENNENYDNIDNKKISFNETNKYNNNRGYYYNIDETNQNLNKDKYLYNNSFGYKYYY